MLNHARTLLMNVDGGGFGGYLGDQYIPPAYQALSLPFALVLLRRCLFGVNPDRVMLNYRAQQLLALLRCTQLQQFVEALDPRITYDVDDASFFSPANFAPLAAPSAGTLIAGSLASPDLSGGCAASWMLTLSGSTLQVQRLTPPVGETFATVTFSNGLSNTVPLDDSGLSFTFRQGSAAQWRIDALARPAQGLGSIEATLRQIGNANIYALFGAGTPRAQQEPWRTFYNLWLQHPELPYSLGGLVLALIYYTELVRRGVSL